jgi:hypothetical protein
MKKYFIGIITGFILGMSITGSYATIKEFILYKALYPIEINNTVYESEELPILNYQGNTYVPLKNLSEMLNVDVKWDPTDNQVVITNKQSELEEDKIQGVIEDDYYEDDNYFYTIDGIEYVDVDGVKYIAYLNVINTYLESTEYNLPYDSESNTFILTYKGNEILNDIHFFIIKGRSYISYKTFTDYILPEIEQ